MKSTNQMSILDAMYLNAQSLNLRLIYGALIALGATFLIKPIWIVGCWFAMLVIVQTFNRYLIVNHAAKWSEKWRDTLLLIICFTSTLALCWISVVLWLLGGAAGQIASAIFIAAALLHIQSFVFRCPPLFWVSIATFLGALAVINIHAVVANTFLQAELFALLIFGIAFFSNLLLAFNQSRSLTGQLEAEREAAIAANRAKSAFLATMSHELRTPMNGILGGAELLKRSDPTSRQIEILDTLADAGHGLLELLNDLLDLSKIEAGKMTVEEIAFSPRALLRAVERLWASVLDEKGLVFTVKIDEAVPETLIGDPTRVRQIIINLLSNAAKFTQTGSIDVAMQAVPGADGLDAIVVEVRDTGIGMTQEAVNSLFEPFSQADSSISRRFGGTGLGTSISHRLAKLMGGSLFVKSTLSSGTCFTLSLPLVEAKDIVIVSDRNDPIEDADELRILVAEDNASNRYILARFLDIGGHNVTFTEDGAGAVEAANHQAFDLIILDVRMPVMDGLQALSKIRAGGGPNADQPIIMLSAEAMPEERALGMAKGADEYLTKPIDPRLLFSALAMANGGRAAYGPTSGADLSAPSVRIAG